MKKAYYVTSSLGAMLRKFPNRYFFSKEVADSYTKYLMDYIKRFPDFIVAEQVEEKYSSEDYDFERISFEMRKCYGARETLYFQLDTIYIDESENFEDVQLVDNAEANGLDDVLKEFKYKRV